MEFCHVSFVHFQGSKNKEVFNTEELIQVSFPNQREKLKLPGLKSFPQLVVHLGLFACRFGDVINHFEMVAPLFSGRPTRSEQVWLHSVLLCICFIDKLVIRETPRGQEY